MKYVKIDKGRNKYIVGEVVENNIGFIVIKLADSKREAVIAPENIKEISKQEYIAEIV